MIASPSPVQEIAAVASSAHVPAAMIGESPTRPGCLPLVPPVEVAAATPPRASRATAPTVPPPLERALALGGPEPRLGRGVQPGLARELRGRLADEHHVPALLEHGARGEHRVANPAQRGDRARGAVGAAHHRRVEQHEPALVEHRAAARR